MHVIEAHLAATVKGYPVYVHTIAHAAGLVLVDTGMIDSTPELDEEWAPVPMPENIPRDVTCVINTHLDFDHCGGNRLFPGVPIHVQRNELRAPRGPREWVHFEGATYVEHDGEDEVLPGVRLLPAPGTPSATKASSSTRRTASSSSAATSRTRSVSSASARRRVSGACSRSAPRRGSRTWRGRRCR